MKIFTGRQASSNHKKCFLQAVAPIALMALMPSAAYAQDSNNEGGGQVYDEVIVTGTYSGSLASANRLKRSATSVMDAIVAEDIGKLADSNVAKSLQRITGVAIDREGGEGRFISVRGLGPEFVKVTINGRTAPAASSNTAIIERRQATRRFSFDELQSEMVSALEVFKSPQANIITGGIGGVVNVVTPRPLGLGDVRSVSLSGVLDTFAGGGVTPKASALISHEFSDDFGVLVSASYFDRKRRTDRIDSLIFQPIGFGTDPNAEVPVLLRPFTSQQETTRINVSSTLQWRPTDSLELVVDGIYTNFDLDEQIPGLPIGLNPGKATSTNVTSDANGTARTFDTDRAFVRSDNNFFKGDRETLVVGGNLKHTSDLFTTSVDVSYTENDTIGVRERIAADVRDRTLFGISIDSTGRFIPNLTFTGVGDVNDFSFFDLNFIREDTYHTVDSEFQLKGDVEYHVEADMGPLTISSLQFGGLYQDHEQVVDFDQLHVNGSAIAGGADFSQFVIPFLGPDDFLDGIAGAEVFPRSFFSIDVPRAFDHFIRERRGDINPATLADTERAQSDFTIEEKNIELFALVNFKNDSAEIPFRGNFGLRYVDTKQTSLGNIVPILSFDPVSETVVNGAIAPTSVENGYSKFLPSFNVAFDVSDNAILRFGAGRSLTRPIIQDLAPGVTSFNSRTGQLAQGNPNLLPILSWSGDVSMEWYFDDDAIFSAGLFYKNVDSFINQATVRSTFQNPDGTFTPGLNGTPQVFDVSTPRNEEGATLGGFELNFQNQFDSLPAPFDGLGTMINYTYVSSDAKFVNPASGSTFDIPGLSQNTVNLGVFYEKGAFSGRINYNYRSDFLELVSGFGADPEFVAAYSQVDFSTSYNIRENMSIFVEGFNLTDSINRKYTSFDDRVLEVSQTGRRYHFGVRAKF